MQAVCVRGSPNDDRRRQVRAGLLTVRFPVVQLDLAMASRISALVDRRPLTAGLMAVGVGPPLFRGCVEIVIATRAAGAWPRSATARHPDHHEPPDREAPQQAADDS